MSSKYYNGIPVKCDNCFLMGKSECIMGVVMRNICKKQDFKDFTPSAKAYETLINELVEFIAMVSEAKVYEDKYGGHGNIDAYYKGAAGTLLRKNHLQDKDYPEAFEDLA